MTFFEVYRILLHSLFNTLPKGVQWHRARKLGALLDIMSADLQSKITETKAELKELNKKLKKAKEEKNDVDSENPLGVQGVSLYPLLQCFFLAPPPHSLPRNVPQSSKAGALGSQLKMKRQLKGHFGKVDFSFLYF